MSVIVPAFNAERYLAATLSSVVEQTYRDWEVIVADDASTDATVEIAEGFGDRFTVLRTQVNGGPSVSRNRAIEASTGGLLAFLDADDLWLPDYLESQVSLYDESRVLRDDVGIVCCNARILAEGGIRAETYMDIVGRPAEVTLTRLLRRNLIFTGALSPRTVVDKVGGFPQGMVAAEDYDLWLRIVERGYRVVINPRVLATYRLTAGSASSRVDVMARGMQFAYRRALERGKLTSSERRIARRQLRLYRLLDEMATSSAASADGPGRYRHAFRSLPLRLLVLIENPSRWRDFGRRLLGLPPRLAFLERRKG